ncbi:YggT family protein [Granulicatella elegans]|jgi:uncharacterized membrane protein ylmG|uniref:YggT family protein n=1 Tax=Granulicatella elegans TaxID=137732 RepID=UPI000F127B12|nr:YggT family protein [Granulicatella elegans]MBF0993711.1 YggT family protein [Granulicatella sp.]RKW26935.1 MAG: YggT family protein [Granulicatella sp.]
MLLFQLIRLLLRAIDLYILLITIYIVLTWLPQAQNTKLARWLQALCEPYLSYFDKIRIGMFGFSAIFGILFLQFVKLGIIQIVKFIF